MVSRRAALHLAGASLVGFAGCTDRRGSGTPPATESDAPDGTSPDDGGPTDGTPDDVNRDVGIDVEGARTAWTRSIEDDLFTDPVYVDGHVALIAGTTVYGLDAATGETAWTFESPVSPDGDYGRPTATLAAREGMLYALVGISVGTGAHDHVLHALTPAGEERWTFESRIGGFHELVGFGDGAAVLGTSDDAIGAPDSGGHAVVALNLTDGTERWRTETADVIAGTVGDDVAAVRVHGGVDCLDLATGDRRFLFAPEVDGRIATAAVGGGRVFVGRMRYEGDGPTAYALSTVDGTEEWTIEGSVVTSLRYLDDLYVGGEHVERYDPDGTECWRSEVGGIVTRVPFDDDALYTNDASRVVAVDRADGRELWGSAATDLAIPRARDGGAIVSADGGERTVFAHAIADGTERWRARLPEEHPPPPAAGGGGAYLATEGGTVLRVPL